jgi:hypothetical protein
VADLVRTLLAASVVLLASRGRWWCWPSGCRPACRLLSDGSTVTVRPSGGSTVLTFDHGLDGTYAPAVAVRTA